MLAEAIGEKGLKPTATGNLPRKTVQAVGQAYASEKEHLECSIVGEPRSEPDFEELHVTRLVAAAAGLTHKYQGKFILCRKYRTIKKKMGLAGVYPLLLRAFATRYNWAYQDLFDDLSMIQHTFLFTAYLLQRFGDQWRETAFYEDAFLRAFPQTLEEVPQRQYGTPESTVRHAYTVRALDRFAAFLGLAEMRPIGGDPWDRRYEIRKLPLLDTAIIFALPGENTASPS